MTFPLGRSAAFAVLASALLLGSACTRIKDRQGHLLDETLVSAIQPGVDNKNSVAATLGRPSFIGQFDDRDWYYVSRETEQLAFAMPRPESQTVLRVRFDEAGNVVSVDRSGLEQVASINPTDKETPTLGRNRSFFEELFGNIGTVGSGGVAASTADNPR